MQRPPTLVIVIGALTVSLTGCGEDNSDLEGLRYEPPAESAGRSETARTLSPALSPAEAQTILTDYLRDRCAALPSEQERRIGQGALGTFRLIVNAGFSGGSWSQQAEEYLRWFDQSVAGAASATLIAEERTPSAGGRSGQRRTYALNASGNSYTYQVETTYGLGDRMSLYASGCWGPPTANILDRTPDPNNQKLVTVVFSVAHASFPGLPGLPSSPGDNMTSRLHTFQASSAQQYRAQFQYLDATGWQLQSRPDGT